MEVKKHTRFWKRCHLTRASLSGEFACIINSHCDPFILGKMAHRGDLIGCVIMYNKRGQDKLPVCFTLNGSPVKEGYLHLPTNRNINFYPFIGIGDPEIKLVFRVCIGRFALAILAAILVRFDMNSPLFEVRFYCRF